MAVRACTAVDPLRLVSDRRDWLDALRRCIERRAWLLHCARRIHDEDGDRVPDFRDNCRCAANPEQRDFDRDGRGDVCDHDDDNDGVPDVLDPAPLNPRAPGPPWPPPDEWVWLG